jgi:hypothetical protein
MDALIAITLYSNKALLALLFFITVAVFITLKSLRTINHHPTSILLYSSIARRCTFLDHNSLKWLLHMVDTILLNDIIYLHCSRFSELEYHFGFFNCSTCKLRKHDLTFILGAFMCIFAFL